MPAIEKWDTGKVEPRSYRKVVLSIGGSDLEEWDRVFEAFLPLLRAF
jgi:hypothetical protein